MPCGGLPRVEGSRWADELQLPLWVERIRSELASGTVGHGAFSPLSLCPLHHRQPSVNYPEPQCDLAAVRPSKPRGRPSLS